MKHEPTKPVGTKRDDCDVERAALADKPAGDAVGQDSEQEEPDAEEAAAQLGDFT